MIDNLNSDKFGVLSQFDKQLETVYAENRKEWREWLEKNHHTCVGVWLIYYKVSQRVAGVPPVVATGEPEG